jgi:hypothetical protein
MFASSIINYRKNKNFELADYLIDVCQCDVNTIDSDEIESIEMFTYLLDRGFILTDEVIHNVYYFPEFIPLLMQHGIDIQTIGNLWYPNADSECLECLIKNLSK